ncbi:MAG: hypothetical protein NW241_10290 [Bacteroidia bacterium]|nr:hypothetical protein [Bacteroidia bacterium]
MNRRYFLRRTALGAGLSALPAAALQAAPPDVQGPLTLSPPANGLSYAPLERLRVEGASRGRITLLDGQGRAYAETEARPVLELQIGGALGRQELRWQDAKGRLLGSASFHAAAQTRIQDRSGRFGSLLDLLHWTMIGQPPARQRGDDYPETDAHTVRIGGKLYSYFVCWLRDHVHSLKGMKYFAPELRSGIDLYADFQREDGMIWDNIYLRNREKNWWDKRFSYGGFIREIENGLYELKRIPVEADVEYLFVEGLYATWKATGDSPWMHSKLDHAVRALNYCMQDPYRWSERRQLIKRGFTIDTWDFQSDLDTPFSNGDIMTVHLGQTRFGIMHGDNTGYAMACGYLAEMLEHAGRGEEAAAFRARGAEIRQRLDALAWNGRFFTHHVPEDPEIQRDLGVDQQTQISMSNAYGLNRGLSHAQCAAIIRHYQQLRDTMPEGAPGEWYTIYPPFPTGFNGPAPMWEYMNAGVTPIVAGELAHGAFEHGFEAYGADILLRLRGLAQETDGYLYCTYRGRRAEAPARTFNPLDISSFANAVYPSPDAESGGRPWHETCAAGPILGIPFRAEDPRSQPFTALGLRGLAEVRIPAQGLAGSVYLLHTYQGPYAGDLTWAYADGSQETVHLTGAHYGHWWNGPAQPAYGEQAACRDGWRSDNHRYEALYICGLDNPHPERPLAALILKGSQGRNTWHLAALTLCDAPVWFDPGKLSYGIPNAWGAAAVVYALLEGLAGVQDLGTAMDRILLAPRWAAAAEEQAEAVVKYEASGGYAACRYERTASEIRLDCTSSASTVELHLLLPPDAAEPAALYDGSLSLPFTLETIGSSRYLNARLEGPGVWNLRIRC